jgi:hypothetical protein
MGESAILKAGDDLREGWDWKQLPPFVPGRAGAPEAQELVEIDPPQFST